MSQALTGIRVIDFTHDPLLRTGERERRLAVIEFGALPGRRSVTERAVRREPGRRMIRIGGFIEVREVA